MRLRTASTHGNVPREVWAGRRALFLHHKGRKKQEVASNEVLPNPYVSAEKLKACALIGLHLLAADDEVGSSGIWEM